MPTAPVTYHWAEDTVDVVNPPIFTNNYCDIILPAKHTLRRFVNSTPTFYWKRGSNDFTNQEMYFVRYDVTYGYTDDPPLLYRSLRSLRHNIVADAASLTEGIYSQWYGADLELGFNERAQRGGFYSDAQRLRLTWSIISSGSGGEVLQGEASVQFRALYSLPILP